MTLWGEREGEGSEGAWIHRRRYATSSLTRTSSFCREIRCGRKREEIWEKLKMNRKEKMIMKFEFSKRSNTGKEKLKNLKRKRKEMKNEYCLKKHSLFHLSNAIDCRKREIVQNVCIFFRMPRHAPDRTLLISMEYSVRNSDLKGNKILWYKII